MLFQNANPLLLKIPQKHRPIYSFFFFAIESLEMMERKENKMGANVR
jgi:hypothetical protein